MRHSMRVMVPAPPHPYARSSTAFEIGQRNEVSEADVRQYAGQFRHAIWIRVRLDSPTPVCNNKKPAANFAAAEQEGKSAV